MPLDWDELFRRHARDLRRLIARKVPAGAVDEVFQETSVRAVKSCARFDPSRPAWPWLATLAHRSCTKWWRTHRATADLSDEAPSVGTGVDLTPGSDDHLSQLDQSRVVAVALGLLPPRQRRVLYLHDAEDVPYDRLAEAEAISYKALKSLLCRARACFRRHYLRLLEESVGALGSARVALARLRSRLSGRGVPGWERVGSLAGAALAAGIVGAFTVPGAAPPAQADPDGSVVPRPAGAVSTPVAGAPPSPERAGTEGRLVPARRGVERPGPRPTPPGPEASGGAGGAPIEVDAGGGLAHGPASSTVTVWAEVNHPTGGRIIGVGTEVRCDAGKVSTAECVVLRAIPSAG